MIEIGDVLVSSEVVTEFFCCDYAACKGVCCIEGDSGAPLREEEAVILEREYINYKDFMSPEGRERIAQTGFFEVDTDGDLVTPLLKGKEECAYTRFEGDNCLCAIEKAHLAGRCRFVKPISCRLYPIRVSVFSNGTKALNLHRWEICRCAFEKGRREGIRVYEFLKKPLADAFGEEFYSALESLSRSAIL
ncbi:MAG: DUF3109 family protein [Bacteroidales bacterium]|nr:DUF3109 family protein [Bacteroidales bacterium]